MAILKTLTDKMHDLPYIKNLYRATRLEVIGQLEKAKTEASILRQRAILGNIDQILNETSGKTKQWVDKVIPGIYKDGANQAVQSIVDVGGKVKVATGFSVIHEQAIAALADDTFLAFGQGLTVVRNSARGTLAAAAKIQIRDQIGKGVVQGNTLKDTKTAVAQVIKDRGVSALQDRSGKSWDLETYAEMLTRTKQREVYNSGTANRLVENGYDLAEISNHHADDSCADWEGEIISLTGATPGYPTLSEVEGDDTHMFGPNCRHTYTAYIPGLSGE